jgi:hypothetical protein
MIKSALALGNVIESDRRRIDCFSDSTQLNVPGGSRSLLLASLDYRHESPLMRCVVVLIVKYSVWIPVVNSIGGGILTFFESAYFWGELDELVLIGS